MKATGQFLRENREKQGLTINEVALLIKVNTKTVVAIEEGDLDSLPAKTFLRGFVRSYGKLLKLDVKELLEKFYEEMGSTKPKLAIRDQNNEERRKKAIEQSMEGEDSPLSKKILWGLAGAFAILMIVFVVKQVDKYEEESKTVPPSADLKAINPIEKKEEVAKPEEPQEEVQEASTQNAEIQDKKVKETVAQKKEEPKATEETKKSEEAEKSKEVAKVEKPKPAEKPKATKKSQEIILEAFDRITVTYSVGGKNSTLTLKEDDVRIIKGAGSINLQISDGGSVNLVHNGKDLGVPGALGSPLKLTLQ